MKTVNAVNAVVFYYPYTRAPSVLILTCASSVCVVEIADQCIHCIWCIRREEKQ